MATEQKRKLAVGVPALLVVALLCAAFIGSVLFEGGPRIPRVRMSRVQIAKISIALLEYHGHFDSYPPDTGYGLDPTKSSGLYDSGSLWRHLTKPTRNPTTGEKVGPFLEEWPKEYMSPYDDPKLGRSFRLTDPWGNPFVFVGDPKRVIHCPGSFDLFSIGPNGTTASDEPGAARNLAYDGLDNDGNEKIDDAAELGAATRNGEVDDDVNNWD
jgi:hypothetical protein